MISQKWSKLIRGLHQKKQRKIEQCFIVEGEKAVLELLASNWQITALFATERFLQQHASAVTELTLVQSCSADELAKVGTFSSNDAALAVVAMPEAQAFSLAEPAWILVLDQINDPGNLGSIIRIADWYGIKHIVCSTDTADMYNPKVIAAAKGSFLRVNLYYQDLAPVLAQQLQPVYGAYLGGESVHSLTLKQPGGFIVMGNEANGISAELSPLITKKITIPAYGAAESLNVGIATAIICDNLCRLSVG
ncbi:TrmH family RNA methyltransferase [Rheinheimera salexigens]|uniref:RNA methyltransferase n=1 Tax=Rheinheimera salexigens TaxID=1628148 RepID=A0A1E7Q301_9GAMM|nr:RNA methyltransferase [Rheinheimera salexigens]OEY68584.1 RNA methyltransferase [Rheinheimera salexigens]